jgi:glycosyltransferase involved in cell wall biosynthesis
MRRICHVSPHLPPDQAANALLPAQLGRWMAQRGDQIAFVAHEPAQAGASHAATSPWSDAVVRWIPRRDGSGVTRLLKIDAWQLARRVHAALTEVAADADLLHLHSNGLIVEAAAIWARQRRIPYVLTLYGTEIWHYKKRWPIDLFARAYARADRVTFYSQRLLERAKAVRLERAGLSVIYPPVAESFTVQNEQTRLRCRTALGIRERFVILNVKRLHPLAGQKFLIDAFAQVCRSRADVRLIICGDGALRDELRSQAASLGVADRVTLAGLVPNDVIADYMAAADVFALPSILEALPTVAVEALASGTPVISADHPGGVELHGVFGDDVTVVPRENAGPLARALADFLEHPRRALPGTARQIERLFRPAAVLKAFDAVYARARPKA